MIDESRMDAHASGIGHDLLEVLAEQITELSKIVAREQARETSSRR